MNEKLKELLRYLDITLTTNHSMTTEEILDCIHCGVDEEGEIIDLNTGKPTGIWYEEIEY